MRVLHIDEQMTWRGGEQQASWLLQGLAARGHEVALAARPGSLFLEAEHGGAPVERLAMPLRNEADLASAWRMARFVREWGADIIHAHTSHAHMIACFTRMFAGRAKVVASRRIDYAPKHNVINRWKYQQPDMLVAVSGEVGKVLARFGVPENRRRVVYSAVDLARLDVPPLERREMGIPEGVPLLVSAGALVGHKDHATLLRAFPAVLAEFPDAQLAIAGEGDLRAELEQIIEDLNLRGKAHLLGHRKDAPRMIRAGDVYVSSSWSEGLGTSVLEALACKTPVVATVAGGVGEMVLDGKTGYLVPNRDPEALAGAIRASLHDREGAARMADAGLDHVKANFVVDRMVEGNLAVYEELLGRRHGEDAA